MNAIDYIISSDEPIVQAIEEDQGLLQAEWFMDAFNNACLQYAGFESITSFMSVAQPTALAPLTNLSYTEH